jgi:acetyltransferase-like isoleucine patch superfamily enzyme
MSSDILGTEYMGDNVRDKLKKCGVGVKINPLSKMCKPEVIELDDYCRICDFVFIWGGLGVRIGKYTDIQPHVTIWGGGEIVIGDYVSVAVGAVLLTAVYSHKEGLRMVDGLPDGATHALYGKLVIKNDVYIGANCTIMPDVTIGEGAIIGAGSFVNKNVEPWSINVGSPARKIGERPKLVV